MRKQEGSLAKRRKPSPPVAALQDSDAEMSRDSFGDGDEDDDEDGIELEDGRLLRGKRDGSDRTEDEDEGEDSEDGENDEDAAGSHAPWETLDADSALSSRIAIKLKSSASRQPGLPNQHDLKTSPQRNATFASLDISPPLISALSKMAIRAPTEIQLACIPPLLAGEWVSVVVFFVIEVWMVHLLRGLQALTAFVVGNGITEPC